MAFSKCESLNNIVIPDSVTRIGTCAFFSCEKLTNLTMAKNVKKVGLYAFSRTPFYKNFED